MTVKNNIQRLESYNSYSGCDMVASININSHDALKTKSYTLGSIQTISISTHQDKRPVRSLGNINAKEYTMGQRTIAGSLVFAVFDRHFADQIFKDSLEASQVGTSTIILPDELPPFDITISYANEYGHASKMVLYGVRLVNEGQVMSINDIYTENTYQFVATGLEPLNKQAYFRENWSKNNGTNTNTIHKKKHNNINNVNRILQYEDYGRSYIKKEVINLSVTTEQPHSKSDYGIAKFYLSPTQSTGQIKIFAGSSNNDIVLDLETFKDNNYYVYLPIDNYYAYYETDSKLSNTVNFSMYHISTDRTHIQDMPVINYATHNSISITSNNPTHDKAICIKQDRPSIFTNFAVFATPNNITADIVSKKAIFKDLLPGEKYSIYTYNSKTENKSANSNATTLKYKTQIINEFIEFLSTNSNLLTYEKEDYINIINSLEFHLNLIDMILSIKDSTDLKENRIKQELLFFAIKYQNLINCQLNKSALLSSPQSDINNAFYNTFNFDKNAASNTIYRKVNNKNYFETKVNNQDKYTFLGKDNIKFICNSTNHDNIRSADYEFCFFSYDNREVLDKFSQTYKLNEMSDIPMDYEVGPISYTQCLAKYYKKPSLPILVKPQFVVNEDLSLKVILNYNDVLTKGEQYILSIAQTHECLDNTPIIKVRFNYDGKVMNLDSSVTKILKNKSYTAWIEDINLNTVSNCETFNTYLEDIQTKFDDEELNIKEVEKEINKIIKVFEENIKLTDELTSLLYSVTEQEDIHLSNLYDRIIEVLIDNKIIIRDFESIIKVLFEAKYNLDLFTSTELSNKAIYDTKSNNLRFQVNKPNTYLVTIVINEEDNTITKNVHNTNAYNIDERHLTLAYILDNNKISKSGFVLINPKNKDVLSHDMKVEVI